jgi:hypothetical protein
LAIAQEGFEKRNLEDGPSLCKKPSSALTTILQHSTNDTERALNGSDVGAGLSRRGRKSDSQTVPGDVLRALPLAEHRLDGLCSSPSALILYSIVIRNIKR